MKSVTFDDDCAVSFSKIHNCSSNLIAAFHTRKITSKINLSGPTFKKAMFIYILKRVI